MSPYSSSAWARQYPRQVLGKTQLPQIPFSLVRPGVRRQIIPSLENQRSLMRSDLASPKLTVLPLICRRSRR